MRTLRYAMLTATLLNLASATTLFAQNFDPNRDFRNVGVGNQRNVGSGNGPQGTNGFDPNAGNGPVIGRARQIATSPARTALIQQYGADLISALDQAIASARAELPRLSATIEQRTASALPNSGSLGNVEMGLTERKRVLEKVAGLNLDQPNDIDVGLAIAVMRRDGNAPLLKVLKPKLFLGYYLCAFDELMDADRKKHGVFFNIAQTMSPSDVVAIYGYTTIDFVTINRALRNNLNNNDFKIYAGAIEEALQRAPLLDTRAAFVVTRRNEGQWDGARNYYADGTTITLNSFLSTSNLGMPLGVNISRTDPNFVNVEPNELRLYVRGRGRDVSAISAHSAELEVLYPPGARFTVEWLASAPNHNVVFLSEVSEPPATPPSEKLADVAPMPQGSGQTGNGQSQQTGFDQSNAGLPGSGGPVQTRARSNATQSRGNFQ